MKASDLCRLDVFPQRRVSQSCLDRGLTKERDSEAGPKELVLYERESERRFYCKVFSYIVFLHTMRVC